MTRRPAVFTIPAGVPFARQLAQNLFIGNPDPVHLSRLFIFLPTRRACRAVREAFLRESGGKPLLLPLLQPLGDIPEDDGLLPLSGNDLPLKPAIAPLRRLMLLGQLIAAREGGTLQVERHIPMARALARLMDQTYTENLDLKDLPRLVEGTDFSSHWQITVDFLSLISLHWPQILEQEGVIDAADRRNRLLNALADHWIHNPPNHPVIAAGSTGSIPAVARLLGVIAHLPNGTVILPGLDQLMDANEWDAIDDTHPQATMKNLLQKLDCTREIVRVWPSGTSEIITPRQRLAREMMRPATHAHAWQTLHWTKIDTAAAIKGLHVYEADTAQDEAETISLLLRETLEIPEKTALVVTPDRNLARRIIQACRKWDIPLDDSAGQPMTQQERVHFFLSIADAAAGGLRPGLLLSILKHRLCCTPFSSAFIGLLERDILRGIRPPPGPDGLTAQYHRKVAEATKRGRTLPASLEPDISRLNSIMSPFYALFAQNAPLPLSDYLEAHIRLAQTLVNSEELWRREDGEALAGFLAQLAEQAKDLPPILPSDYPLLLRELMRDTTLRPTYGTHPRLAVMGQLEARLIHADRLILAGLNEGTWPADVQPDPFLSRPMKRDFGLPPPERGAGLAAHDFVQGFGAKEVYLTRAKKIDGAPAIPSRWISRLDTVLTALDVDPAQIRAKHISSWLEQYYAVPDINSYERPAPRPPADLRPDKLSVTRIERWRKDPYSIYAESILRLSKLDPLEQEPDAAARGNLVHAILEDFIGQTEKLLALPPNAETLFLTVAKKRLPDFIPDEADRAIIWPRLVRLAGWFIEQENAWRRNTTPNLREVKARWTLQPGSRPFTLTGIADRIDQRADGSAALIDYKTGKTGLSLSGIKNAKLPQLPLEALMLKEGAFDKITTRKVGTLAYWIASGGRTPGEVIVLDDETAIESAMGAAREALETLITTFEDPQTPYYALPVLSNAPRFNDYLHLERAQEWTALDDGEAEE